jgi:hypothetical protein
MQKDHIKGLIILIIGIFLGAVTVFWFNKMPALTPFQIPAKLNEQLSLGVNRYFDEENDDLRLKIADKLLLQISTDLLQVKLSKEQKFLKMRRGMLHNRLGGPHHFLGKKFSSRNRLSGPRNQQIKMQKNNNKKPLQEEK